MGKLAKRYWPYLPPFGWLAGLWLLYDLPEPVMNWLPQVDAEVFRFISLHFDAPLSAIFWLGVGVCLLVGWGIARLLRLRAPRLYFGEPFVQRVQLYATNVVARVLRTPTHEVNVASVSLHNNPKIKSHTSKLERAHITIEFYEKGTKHLIKVLHFGRWADNIQLGQHDSPSNVDPLRYRDIEPNDGANIVDIALKYDGDENCCAFNSESWLEPDLKNPRWIIEGIDFDVRLIIISSNYNDYEGWFEMKNLGEGGSLTIMSKRKRGSLIWRAVNISVLKKPAI